MASTVLSSNLSAGARLPNEIINMIVKNVVDQAFPFGRPAFSVVQQPDELKTTIRALRRVPIFRDATCSLAWEVVDLRGRSNEALRYFLYELLPKHTDAVKDFCVTEELPERHMGPGMTLEQARLQYPERAGTLEEELWFDTQEGRMSYSEQERARRLFPGREYGMVERTLDMKKRAQLLTAIGTGLHPLRGFSMSMLPGKQQLRPIAITSTLASLRRLNLVHHRSAGSPTPHLAFGRLTPNLEALEVTGFDLDYSNIGDFELIPSLQALCLTDCKIEPFGIKPTIYQRALETLELRDCSIAIDVVLRLLAVFGHSLTTFSYQSLATESSDDDDDDVPVPVTRLARLSKLTIDTSSSSVYLTEALQDCRLEIVQIRVSSVTAKKALQLARRLRDRFPTIRTIVLEDSAS